jgi:hypothetical protein
MIQESRHIRADTRSALTTDINVNGNHVGALWAYLFAPNIFLRVRHNIP